MINVSADFKTAMKASTKQIRAYAVDQEVSPTQINEDDDLKFLKIKSGTSLLHTVMRSAEIRHFNNYDWLNKYINLGIGVVKADDSTEYIDFGSFKVVSKRNKKESELTTLKLYDKMHESLQRWDLDPIYDMTYPATIKELLEAICTRFSWTLNTDNIYANTNLVTNGDLENWSAYGDADNWTESVGGSGSVNQEFTEYKEGDYAMRIDIDGSNSNTYAWQTINVDPLKEYVFNIWVKVEDGGHAAITLKDSDSYYIQASDFGWNSSYTEAIIVDSTTWVKKEVRFTTRAGVSTVQVSLKRSTSSPSSNKSLYFDSINLFDPEGFTMSDDVFTGAITVYREALEMIAEVAGGILYFNYNDELTLKRVDHTTSLETIDKNMLESLTVEKEWGGVNSLVLSRTPQEDNITKTDGTLSTSDDFIELKVENNLIVDNDRESFIEPIYHELHGLTLTPFEARTNGLGYFEIGDRITVQDAAAVDYETIVLGMEIRVAGGMKEYLYAETPDKSNTRYEYAGHIGQAIRNTEIKVDKQDGEITIITQDLNDSVAQINLTTDAITSSVNQALAQGDANADDIVDVISDVTTLQQTATDLQIAIDSVGGTNLLKNSVGLKNGITEWQELDDDGDPLDSDNDATIDQSSDVEINSESGSAIKLEEQFIFQTFPTIAGEKYTFYCRYKSTLTATVEITGQSNLTMAAAAGWTVFKTQFTASSDTTTLKITNVSAGSGATVRLTDSIVKLGDINGWVQAPNEVYGANFRFDKDGFEITSLTDAFKSVLDNSKLAVYDTNLDRLVMLVSKDEGKVTKLTAQDEFVLQRYENPSASMRLIPTSTGAMLVINDS
jgi:hypothetical protein